MRPALNTQLFEYHQPNNTGIAPSTRYQGSKYKIVDWIYQCTKRLNFHSVLDAFGGTGSVGYRYKNEGKQVFYNDLLCFNNQIGLALIENSKIKLTDEDVAFILTRHKGTSYPTFIFDTFHDIYYTDEENVWLDFVVTNIRQLKNKYKQAIALYAVYQACTIKRPYNLFHRKNLYIRTADVERSFGNKKTWDEPFEAHFKKFVAQANIAIFDNGKDNKAFHKNAFDININADLVYIDTPYISSKGVGINYLDFYHFLEGLTSYKKWRELIDEKSKHRRIKNGKSEWSDKRQIHAAFRRLFDKFQDSILVVSYRNDGTPSISELTSMLAQYKDKIEIHRLPYKYALSKNSAEEVLIIAE